MRQDGGDGDFLADLVERHESEIGRGRVFDLAGVQVFDEDLYADFHRSAKDPIDAGFKRDELADVDGVEKRHTVDGGGDDGAARVAGGGEGGGEVDKGHDFPAEEGAEDVGVIRKSELAHFRSRFADRSARLIKKHIFRVRWRGTMGAMSSRLEILRGMLDQDPTNTFARYGLAMEFANQGDFAGAVTEFEALIASKPDYCAAYFHGGQTLEKLGQPDEAGGMYRRGIEAATKAGDSHTRGELEGALAMLP